MGATLRDLSPPRHFYKWWSEGPERIDVYDPIQTIWAQPYGTVFYKGGGSEGPERINVYDPIQTILAQPYGTSRRLDTFTNGGPKDRKE